MSVKNIFLLLASLLLVQFLIASDLVTVKRVIDGDTFETNIGESVRLPGAGIP